MSKMTVDERWGKDAPFFHAHRGPNNTIYPITPWVLTHHLAALGLSTPEQLVCRALLDFKYSLAMAKMDLGELAQEIGRSIRQVQRIVKKLRDKELIKVTARPGRPSIIDVSPLVVAVKQLVGWQEVEQPAAEPETLADVAPEPEPTEEEIWWLQAADSEEDAAAEAEAAEEDVGALLDWQRLVEHIDRRGHLSAGQRRHLDNTKGLRWEGLTLIVQAQDKGQIRFLENLDATISLSVLDVFGLDYTVQFEPVKKPKRAPLLTLVAATVGV